MSDVRPILGKALAPTQVKRPWRATARTVFQALVGLAVVLPFAVESLGLDAKALPWLGGVLAVAAGITRVMALPQVNDWLGRFLPFLAADSKRTPSESGHAAVIGTMVLFTLAVAVLVSVYLLTRDASTPLAILGKASILGKA